MKTPFYDYKKNLITIEINVIWKTKQLSWVSWFCVCRLIGLYIKLLDDMKLLVKVFGIKIWIFLIVLSNQIKTGYFGSTLFWKIVKIKPKRTDVDFIGSDIFWLKIGRNRVVTSLV